MTSKPTSGAIGKSWLRSATVNFHSYFGKCLHELQSVQVSFVQLSHSEKYYISAIHHMIRNSHQASSMLFVLQVTIAVVEDWE